MKVRPGSAVVLLLAAGFLVAPAAPAAQAAPEAQAAPAAQAAPEAPPAPSAPKAAAAALPSNPVDYAYDGAGQLRGVTQAASGGQSARYGYDDGGNLVSVERSASSALTVSSVVPSQAPVGASVTISGTGFAATAAGNTVRFNGTAATVTQASAVRLVVTVPSGATNGAVTVTTAAGTATSAQAFTVGAALAVPAVTALSPTRAAVGGTVTITGTGFDTSAAGNIVSFGRTRARVTAATATSLTVTVPEAAGSGRVTVATAGGSATSGSDFVVVPTPYAAVTVNNTGVLPVDTGSASISVPTANQVSVWRFTGTKGQRLSLGLTGETFTTDFQIALFSPYGAPFGRDEFNQPWLHSKLTGGIPLPPLPTTGTYQIVVDPLDAGTGAVTATLSSRVTGALSLTGSGTPVSLSRAGQYAELTVTVTAGQRINLGFSGATFASGVRASTTILEPNGSIVPAFNGAKGVLLGLADGSDYDITASLAGTYTILFGTLDQSTGSVTVTASPELNAGALTVGTAKSVSISRPGQDARMTFAGTAGQRLSLDFSAYTFTYSPFVTVYAPDGTVLREASVSSLHLDLPDLPATGTYATVVSPFSSTGSFTALLSQRQDAGTITTTGPAVTVTLAQPGRTAELGFTATAGQRLVFAFSSWTFAASTLRATVYGPTGATVVAYDVYSLATFVFTAQAAGNYRLTLANGTSTGSVAVTLSAEVNGGAVTVGTAKTVTASRLGQSTLVTFAGTAGQRLTLSFAPSSYTFQYQLWVTVMRPDGTVFKQASLTTYEMDLDPLPVAGTYQIILLPYAETGSAAFTLRQRADAGATTVGGATKVLTVGTAGQYVETSFTATANQRLGFGLTSWTFASGVTLRTRLINAQGGTVFDYNVSNGGSIDVTAPAAGTYRLIVYASNLSTGSVTLTLSEQLNAGTITLNTAKTVTISRAGQSARMTYAGTAGQNLALSFTNITMAFYPSVVVRRPDGTVLTQSAGGATVNIATLPTTGTYEIVISPYSSTGAATLTLGTRSALAMATPDADGKASAHPRTTAAPTIKGATPAKRVPLPKLRSLTRAGHAVQPARGQGGETWTPDRANLAGADWYSHREVSDAPAPSALRAPAGKTAVSGRVLTLDAKPLPGVAVSVDGVRATTDKQGQFLLADLKPGRRVLRVDGASASSPGRRFGLHDIGVDLIAGQTLVLPYTVWLSKLDTSHTVRFASPTDREVSITTPAIPGLEVRLPKGAVVRDVTGKVVTELGITAIPLDRSPFPLPRAQVPSYFTVQPGSAYVFPTGARVIYPNFTKAKPGSKMDFWHYEPAGRGWFVYGHGTVTPDGTRVEPDKGTEVYQFTGAMLITPGYPPPPAQAPVPGGGARGGDPVDLGSGLLVDERTDLAVDDVIPLSLTRTYQQSDTGKRSFGIGVNSDYDLNLYSENRFVDCWLLLPDGGRVRYHRITPGSTGPGDYINAAFAPDPTPTRFSGSILAWNGDGWDLRMRDGTVYVFGDEAPLQEIRDRYGNTVTITRAPAAPDSDGITRAKGPITQVTSPNGKWIKFTNDTSDRVTRAEDNSGRAVSYTYHPSGHLATVTDANGGVTQYTYESGRMKTIRDARDTVYLVNEYDANGRVSKQTMPDGGTYLFAYTTDSAGRVTETRLTDPRGNVRRVTFNAAGFSTSDTAAFGTSAAQTLQITRHPNSNLPTAYVDALNRRTELAYDAFGNVTGITELAGTANTRSTTIAYDGPFDQVSKVTDPLTHSTDYAYQANGALRTVTDPMSRVTTLDTNEAGQVTKVTDNDNKATSFGYVLGDLATVTDPLGRVSRSAVDGLGRPVRMTDPQGNVTRVTYDGFDNVRTVTDPIGRLTDYQYDPNGNLETVTDPRRNATEYGYDSSDRLHTVTDPLNRVTTYEYDGNGNLKTATSARGKVTSYDYDELDRPKLVRYGVSGTTQESQVAYTYDAGNRVRTVVDSAGGSTTITPDDLDRVTRVVSPQGQVDYTYDRADRRATLQVAGQPQVVYGYNNADQLTSVARDTEIAAIGYDNVGRRKTLTLPAGVTQTYGYDPASQVTSITYTRGTATLGDLTYGYDEAGNPIRVAGSFARGTIPAAYGPASYDKANQLITNGVANHTYDPDGNLTSDGTATYTWNARGQLTTYGKPGLTVSYGYDGLGRRSSRDTGGVNTNYLYDGLNVAQEYTGSTPSARLLTGGIDEVFNRTTTGGDRSLLTDALGSTIAGADSHSIGVEYTYEPFGATTVTGNDLGNPTRFTGREDDPSGLYYYRNRFYSPSASRFISQDPLGLGSGDTNPYTYVFNQPTTFVDPMGTKPQGSGDGCVSNSFTAGTPVLMADGSRKPIEQVKPGDKVMATDAESGQSSAKPVTAAIKGEGGKRLIDVTVVGEDGSKESLTATDGHPFWVDDDGKASTPGGQWIDAVDLKRGQWLKSADGALVRVAGTHAYQQHAVVYNLTVSTTHTYHVVAGDTSVLVHNCSNIDYGSINEHGQRSGVRALLDSTNLGGRTRPRPTEPIHAYVPGQDNRTHLLGAFIGGSNTDPRNFVAMFRQANNPVMLRYEYQIRDALKAGQQVAFEAKPIYRGTDPRPLGITISARGSGPNPLMLDVTVLNRGY
ncbi:RHS repeat-associated core domain-containing protein [Actinomycetes bacterium KLBMP 9797]